jgi:choline-sulfatase
MVMVKSIRARSGVIVLGTVFAIGLAACGPSAPAPKSGSGARNLLIITVDTLRADRVGAYGYTRARTPAIDALARRGVRFERAYAPAPITLPSHASLMSGRYPAGHGARHNGMRVDADTPTLARTLSAQGFATGAFVAAFPLDRRFGLNQGFAAYGDRMPPGTRGRLASERPGREVAEEAIAWLARHRAGRFFLWVHFFEPHAPYGDPASGRSARDRYDEEIAEADRQAGRVLDALGPDAAATVVVFASDHGEAFGEHGEVTHSLFVYDTTLRVPLVIAGPSVPHGHVAADPVGLIDVAPTVAALLGLPRFDADGIDLTPHLRGEPLPVRGLYAESFAPLLDFGWSALRAWRSEGWKVIAAPAPELYRVAEDPAEQHDRHEAEPQRTASMLAAAARISGPELSTPGPADPEAAARLQALGYASGARGTAGARPDPKDRRELAARVARVSSGELHGPALEGELRAVLAEDPKNPQAHLRLGHVLLEATRCGEAEPHFLAAIAAGVPSADAHLGLAGCRALARDFAAAARELRQAERVEPDNPVVAANLGIVLSDGGAPAEGVPHLERALAIDPAFHEARFNLAIAFGRAGDRRQAAMQAEELLRRLPAGSHQRAEVERLLASLR